MAIFNACSCYCGDLVNDLVSCIFLITDTLISNNITLISNNIPFAVMSGNLSFIFDSLIISTNRTTAFATYSVLYVCSSLICGFENMSPYEMSVYHQGKTYLKSYNKCLILIRFFAAFMKDLLQCT